MSYCWKWFRIYKKHGCIGTENFHLTWLGQRWIIRCFRYRVAGINLQIEMIMNDQLK